MSLTNQLYQLERKRNEIEARYATDEFEEMVRMDEPFDEKAQKQQNMDLLRQAQEETKERKCKFIINDYRPVFDIFPPFLPFINRERNSRIVHKSCKTRGCSYK